jgi:hypothetical protein
MSSHRNPKIDSEVLSLRQETLSSIRQQLTCPISAGTAEHVAAIQVLVGASFVSDWEILIFKTR